MRIEAEQKFALPFLLKRTISNDDRIENCKQLSNKVVIINDY